MAFPVVNDKVIINNWWVQLNLPIRSDPDNLKVAASPLLGNLANNVLTVASIGSVVTGGGTTVKYITLVPPANHQLYNNGSGVAVYAPIESDGWFNYGNAFFPQEALGDSFFDAELVTNDTGITLGPGKAVMYVGSANGISLVTEADATTPNNYCSWVLGTTALSGELATAVRIGCIVCDTSGFTLTNKVALSGTTSGGLVPYASAPADPGAIVQLFRESGES